MMYQVYPIKRQPARSKRLALYPKAFVVQMSLMPTHRPVHQAACTLMIDVQAA